MPRFLVLVNWIASAGPMRFGVEGRPDSVVLRPVQSVDDMTANVVRMDPERLAGMAAELLTIEGVAAVFYDLTNKPPATIEWE